VSVVKDPVALSRRPLPLLPSAAILTIGGTSGSHLGNKICIRDLALNKAGYFVRMGETTSPYAAYHSVSLAHARRGRSAPHRLL